MNYVIIIMYAIKVSDFMKKYFMVCLLVIASLFINIGNVNAETCEYGIICNYEFCGRRGSATDKGQLSLSCPSNSGNVILSVVYKCSSSDTSAAGCKSFVSWAKIARNLGTGYEDVNFGNYDDVFRSNKIPDSRKDTFKSNGQFSCPSLYASLTHSYEDNTYSFSYSNNGGRIISANATSDGKYSATECVNKGASDTEIDNRLQEIVTGRSSNTSVNQGKEEAENNSGFSLGNNDDNNNASKVLVDTITAWRDWMSTYGYDVDSIGDPCSIISTPLKNLLNTIFWAISIIGIILVVVMTALSFIKAIVGSDDEKFRDAFRHLLTRIIVVIVLLLLPMILSFIITLINDSASGEVTVGKDGNIFCDIAN